MPFIAISYRVGDYDYRVCESTNNPESYVLDSIKTSYHQEST